jgi:hypothetical protein
MIEPIPYIGFTGQQVKDAVPVEAGTEIFCPHCLGTHILEETWSDTGEMQVLYYECGDSIRFAGLNGKLLMGITPAVSSARHEP